MSKIAVLGAIVLLAVLVLRANAASREPGYSNVAMDEAIEFFRTAAWFDETKQEWRVPVHGWVYQPEDSSVRKSLFASIMQREFGLAPTAETEDNFSRRINLMIADNERGRRIVISIAGRTIRLPESAPNGHFSTTVTLKASELAEFADDKAIQYSAVLPPDDDRVIAGEVLLVAPDGLSVISDIDDTVKISNVTDRRGLLENTFLLDFAAVPGMAAIYKQWADQGISVHFVSSSPWQLYAPLDEFLTAAGFPTATLSLKVVRFRDKTLFDLFKKGTETKPEAIENILTRWPARKFILVGDSGEQDPEVYAALLRKFPAQIQKIYLRNVTNASPDDDRFLAVFDGLDADRWQLFDDADAIQSID